MKLPRTNQRPSTIHHPRLKQLHQHSETCSRLNDRIAPQAVALKEASPAFTIHAANGSSAR